MSTHSQAEAGGPRSHVLGVIGGFESLDWQVKPFIVGDRTPWAWRGEGSEQALSSGNWRRLGADVTRITMNMINSRRAWHNLKNQVDWAYERFGVFQALGWPFKRHDIPWIIETNGLYFYEAKNVRKSIFLDNLARHREIWTYRNCDVLVCTSQTLKDLLMEEAGISAEKALVVPDGVDVAFYSLAHRAPKRLFQGFTIGFVGSLIEWQGLDLLISVLAELKDQQIRIFLTVVGDGPMRKTWESQARELKVDDQVRFVGRVSRDDVPDYIAGFDMGFSGQVAFSMGRMYHSPLKLYEYMAMGKPVLASAYEDAQRLVQNRGTGFLFEPASRESLKHELLKAYAARCRFTEMGEKARKMIAAEHSWTARISKMIGDIDNFLENRK